MRLMTAIREGMAGFGRAKLAAAGSILTVAAALVLVGLVYAVHSAATRAIETVRARVEMEAFLQEPVGESRREEIATAIRSIEGVVGIQFISKEEAARIFRQEFGEDIYAVLDFNPLPPSFKITLAESSRTPSGAERVREAVNAVKGVEDVIYRRQMLEFVEQEAGTLSRVGFILSLVVGLSAVFLVSNTIRLTIQTRARVVETMKLVGATAAAVRAPFLVEGALQGILGGAIASGALYYLLEMAPGVIAPELAASLRAPVILYLSIVTAGLGLGLIGSAIAVGRFLRTSSSSKTSP